VAAADRRRAASRQTARRRETTLGELAIENATLNRQVAVLRESNARLEELAGAVTHDLIEGLATISLFAEGLASRLGDEIDPAAAGNLNGIRAGLERMNLLVDEGLKAARVGSRAVPVDAEVALDAALSNLKARTAQIEAEIIAEPLPWVICRAAELTRLFQNLLANSLASKDPNRNLLIRLSARREGLRWRFDVEDTGIGIPPHLAAGGIEPAAPGTEDARHGHGLVICRQIVEAHGGSMRVARRTDGGTTVSFDLVAGNEPGPGPGNPARLASA
jgi:light-regulated signal transduction histidine kinase (bacteriophytochrome)